MNNKFNIKVLNNTENDKLPWADYRREFKLKKFDDYQQLRDWLYVSGVGKVTLKYVDTRTKIPHTFEPEVESEFFGGFHLSWLLDKEDKKNKYLELESFDYRVMKGAA
jgi:hypothetical protein